MPRGKRIIKDKNVLTFFKCVKCETLLNQSEASLGDTCAKCILRSKGFIVIDERLDSEKDFILETIPFIYDNEDHNLIVYCDYFFQPYYEIKDREGVTIYLSEHIKTPEGLEVFYHCVQKELIKLNRQGKIKADQFNSRLFNE